MLIEVKRDTDWAYGGGVEIVMTDSDMRHRRSVMIPGHMLIGSYIDLIKLHKRDLIRQALNARLPIDSPRITG